MVSWWSLNQARLWQVSPRPISMLARMYSDGDDDDAELESFDGVLKIDPELGAVWIKSEDAGGRDRPVSKMRMALSFLFFSNPAAKNSVERLFHARLLQGRPPYNKSKSYTLSWNCRN
jgi:hypothetical protein